MIGRLLTMLTFCDNVVEGATIFTNIGTFEIINKTLEAVRLLKEGQGRHEAFWNNFEVFRPFGTIFEIVKMIWKRLDQ